MVTGFVHPAVAGVVDKSRLKRLRMKNYLLVLSVSINVS